MKVRVGHLGVYKENDDTKKPDSSFPVTDANASGVGRESGVTSSQSRRRTSRTG